MLHKLVTLSVLASSLRTNLVTLQVSCFLSILQYIAYILAESSAYV